MVPAETWRVAIEALWSNKLRAILTTLGVVIGSACIVLVLTVAVTGDFAPEATEQFLVDLSGAVNASIDNGTGTGRILDNDTRTLSINDVTVVEGDSGTTNAVFTATLSEAALAPVTVSFTTSDAVMSQKYPNGTRGAGYFGAPSFSLSLRPHSGRYF